MLDLLIYLFENYLSTKPKLNMTDITLELEEAVLKIRIFLLHLNGLII